MAYTPQAGERQPLLSQRAVDTTEVYPIIQMIRSDAIHFIDTPLTLDALTAPDLTYTLVRPLEDKYNNFQRKGNLSVVFCFLLNRAYFLRDRNLTTSSLSRSRAALCEILATRTLRHHASNMLELALTLTTSWPVYSGADPGMIERAREERDDDLEERVGNAIEIAIIGQARMFIKCSPCQKVIDAIWSGKLVYQADSSRSILSDTYKRNPVHFYDPHKAPLLDHYRLKVPAVRSVLEYSNFVILFILFIAALEFNQLDEINLAEGVFMIYALGFTLEKIAAMQEHGIRVYFKGTWNGFDLAFVTFFCTYGVLRLYGVYQDNQWARETGMDFLAVIAVLMFPRLAFVTLQNNLMVLSLRAMIVQFVVLMLIAAFCFGGFLYALWTLSRNKAGYSAGQIAWWMLDLFFGLDASGFDNATSFDPVFGPVMMVTYACLSNTLLVTVLVSILSHTFTTINDDAAAEAMFRRAVSTIEGVKADYLFSYQPPVNLIALCMMLPASYILTPRWFHKVNVFMIRLTSFPILLTIAVYERQAKRSGAITFYETVSSAAEKVFDTLPRSLKRLSLFEGLAGSDADIDAVFELEEQFEDESALDLHDAGPIPPVENRQRQTSVAPRLRTSFSSHHHQPFQAPQPISRQSSQQRPPSPSPSTHSRKAESNSPAAFGNSAPLPLPRMRLSSLATRNLGNDLLGSAPSPLAQVFQPLFVADDVHHDEGQGQGSLGSLGIEPLHGAVSYGPATRRRLSSMHKRSVTATGDSFTLPGQYGSKVGFTTGGVPLKKLQSVTGPGPAARAAGTMSIGVQPLSESPGEGILEASPDPNLRSLNANRLANQDGEGWEEGRVSSGNNIVPEATAGEIEDEGWSMPLEKKLEAMENRQKRIENMLSKVLETLKTKN